MAKENKKKSDIFEPLEDDCHTDAIIMGYLNKRALQVVPPSLFKILSILKTCIAVEYNIEIGVNDLNPILSRMGKGYMAKQAPILTRDHISTFLQQPDSEFLPQKVKECSLHRIIKSSLPSIHFQSFCFHFIHFTGHRCTGNVRWAAKVRDV